MTLRPEEKNMTTRPEEPSWVEPFRQFMGLELRLTEYRIKDGSPHYAMYDVISPTGNVLFFVASYFDSDCIGSTNGPFCSWRPGKLARRPVPPS